MKRPRFCLENGRCACEWGCSTMLVAIFVGGVACGLEHGCTSVMFIILAFFGTNPVSLRRCIPLNFALALSRVQTLVSDVF